LKRGEWKDTAVRHLRDSGYDLSDADEFGQAVAVLHCEPRELQQFLEDVIEWAGTACGVRAG
jgi:hypothetical protein